METLIKLFKNIFSREPFSQEIVIRISWEQALFILLFIIVVLWAVLR